MKTIFKGFSEDEKEVFINLQKEFYAPPAVIHFPPDEVFCRNFDEAVGNSPFFKAYKFETEGEISGFALISLKYETEVGGMTIWIEELFVKEEYRGNGIGTQFIDFIKSEFGSSIRRIRLEVGNENTGARKLYEHSGFEYLDYLQMTIDY